MTYSSMLKYFLADERRFKEESNQNYIAELITSINLTFYPVLYILANCSVCEKITSNIELQKLRKLRNITVTQIDRRTCIRRRSKRRKRNPDVKAKYDYSGRE